MTKTVALVGMAKATRHLARSTGADEIWTLNHSYAYVTLPRIDRYFDVHPWWLDAPRMEGKPEYAGMIEHWRNVQQIDACPVYMLEKRPEVARSIAYPVERVTKRLFGDRLQIGEKPSDFYKSSFDYMIALAITEGFDVIESYGFEMGSRTEYRHQRQSAAFFIGLAMGRGIIYKLPAGSTQLPRGRYAYESEGDVIYRQTIETELARLKADHAKFVQAETEAAAELREARKRGDPLISDFIHALNQERERVAQHVGAVRELQHLIDDLDLAE